MLVRRFLLIWMLVWVLWAVTLPVGAQEAACARTGGCTLENGHGGDCVTELALTADTDINTILASPEALTAWLEAAYPGYRYPGGDITLRLPAQKYGNVVAGAALADGTLTLRGTEGTEMEGLTVAAEKIRVDGVTFTGSGPAITVHTPAGCEARGCCFSQTGYAFRLQLDENGNAPSLTLAENTFENKYMATLVQGDTEVGKWLAQTAQKPESVVLDLTARITRDTDAAFSVTFPGERAELISSGWVFNFLTACDYETCYCACGGKQAPSVLDAGQVQISAAKSGPYTVVKGAYPTAVNGVVHVTGTDAAYLKEVTVDTAYASATVTRGTKQVLSAIDGGKLTFSVEKGQGDYVIQEVKETATATSTAAKARTVTTSRRYSGTGYQDYHLVTPAGFRDAMRYVRDDTVTLNCTAAGRKPVSLPVSSMAEAAQNGYSLLVKTQNAELTLDAAALKSLAQQAGGTNVLLQYQSLNHKTLSTVGQASVQSHLARNENHAADLAFLVTATSGGETIEDLQQGSVQLKIPFIVLPGQEDKENAVYALQSGTSAEARETAVADGYLTTRLLDLTEHMVFQIGEPVQTTGEATEPVEQTTAETTMETTVPETETLAAQPRTPEKEAGSFPVWLPVLAVLALAGAAGALYFRKRG